MNGSIYMPTVMSPATEILYSLFFGVIGAFLIWFFSRQSKGIKFQLMDTEMQKNIKYMKQGISKILVIIGWIVVVFAGFSLIGSAINLLKYMFV